MSAHPIVLSVIVTELMALAILGAASVGSIRVLLGWTPEDPSRRQLQLERRAEAVSLQARMSVVLFFGATVLLVVAIASVLPGVVPGAMCGTGVLEAMGTAGDRALWLHGLAIAAVWTWLLLDGVNRSSPSAPLMAVTTSSSPAQVASSTSRLDSSSSM